MRTLCILTLVLATSGIAHGDAAIDAAKKQADAMNQAVARGDCAKAVDLTYQGLIDFVGGKEKLIALTESMLKTMKSQGIELISSKLSEPGEIVKEDGKSYIVFPTLSEVKAPQGKMRVKSCLLGISIDDGKSWKFVDGAGLASKEAKDKILPNLPARVKLPAPEVTKD